ncbi:MAG: hypothetical protein MUC92_13575, partial [Fimbriimonadaceae bacterium]|nr:hypothetical protein [Fimbriimonadaceae bacterium]
MSRKRLVIIDGYSLLFRAFYGTRYLSTSDGRPTNALFGFTSMLLQLFQDVRPDALVVALDAPGDTFRHAEYAEYKGTRRETPAELISQLNFSRELISDLNIPVIERVGYEADDVTGTISRMGEENGYETTIVTGDLDALQLVDDWVKVMTTRKGVTDVVVYGIEEVKERYGFGPEYIPDYKALVGDSSDNIPGVPGIGEKSATYLIQKFGSVEQIIENLSEVEEKYRKKLEPGLDQMKKSKWLATIVCDAPVTFDFQPYQLTAEHVRRAKDALLSLEFRSQAKRFETVLAPYILEGAASGQGEIVREVVEATERKVSSVGELLDWVKDQPFALIPESQASPSLFGEDQVAATVAVGKAAARVPVKWADARFCQRPGQALARASHHLTHRSQGTETTPDRFDATLAAYVLQSNR